jgi:CheY-like chemotaxis protein
MGVGDTTPASTASRLQGLTALVVEDEALIFLLLDDMLRELGCTEVQHASGVVEALALLDERLPDLAVLDVNLAGEAAFPVAVRLSEANIPFVFATGYGRQGVPPEWAPQPIIQKPFRIETLAAALRGVLS